MILDFGTTTSTGSKHNENEDCFFTSPELGLFVVADGMGGYKGGKLASNTAIAVIQEYIAEHKNDSSGSVGSAVSTRINEALLESVQAANFTIFNHATQNVSLIGMGTTVVALAIANMQAAVAHVGDSRCYLFREGKLQQITRDHSTLRSTISDGHSSKFQKMVLTRAVGFEESVQVDVSEIELRPGDTLLLCTDGLTNTIEESEIQRILSKDLAAQRAAHELTKYAQIRGSDDDTTVVLVKL